MPILVVEGDGLLGGARDGVVVLHHAHHAPHQVNLLVCLLGLAAAQRRHLLADLQEVVPSPNHSLDCGFCSQSPTSESEQDQNSGVHQRRKCRHPSKLAKKNLVVLFHKFII